MNRGFDTSRGFHFSGIGDTFDWKLSASGISDTCNVDAGYDLIYEDVMPAGGTTSAAYPVNSRDPGNTWVGKSYIHNGEDNRPTNIEIDDFYTLYKSRAAGDAAADADLKAYSAARDNTNEVSKTIREETVRHIESKDVNGGPFFMYVAAMAMRGYGEQSDEQRQKVFDAMEGDIDACDIYDPDLQPFADDTGIKELKRVVELDGQNWNTISAGFYNEFCPINDVKNEIHNGVATTVNSMRRNARFTGNSYSTNIDVLVNATIDALYRKNLWDNTLILLTFDNGGWPNGQAFNWPLRGKCPLLAQTSGMRLPDTAADTRAFPSHCSQVASNRQRGAKLEHCNARAFNSDSNTRRSLGSRGAGTSRAACACTPPSAVASCRPRSEARSATCSRPTSTSGRPFRG